LDNKKAIAIGYAIAAAAFYAISTPISKMLLDHAGPTMLAALLYLGAGIGIGFIFLLKDKEQKGDMLTRSDLPYTAGMIALDIAAPILLMNGVARTAAANVSLLNNFEIVATALIAFFIFREKISKRMWWALFFITLSSIMLSFEGTESLKFSTGSLMVLGAAVCWGFENNCTKMISSKSTYEIVILKGMCSGLGSLCIALIIGEKIPALPVVAIALALGFVAYGLSIFMYIRAQSEIGAAKTSAFYALAPFIGALVSFLLLHEALSQQYLLGLLIMILGSAFAIVDTLKYRHSHIHSHTVYHMRKGVIEKEVITHEHEHSHIGPGLAHHHSH
jgi:Permeases of the drug/metabolite transporter (DMT) superfamily